MARCTRTRNLEIHHKSITGGNGLGNAEVLCQTCHEATLSYGKPNQTSPPPFTQTTKDAALMRAGHRCECTRTGGCH